MCYKPPQNELVFVGDDGDTSDKISKRMANRELPNFPLQECQGDCDSDWDCEVNHVLKRTSKFVFR